MIRIQMRLTTSLENIHFVLVTEIFVKCDQNANLFPIEDQKE